MKAIASILRDISPCLAAISPGISVCVAWNPEDNSDVGWITFIANTNLPILTGPTTLTDTGLVFRQWNVQVDHNGDQRSVVRLVNHVLNLLPDRMS